MGAMRTLSILFLLAATVIVAAQSRQPAKPISTEEARSFGEEMEREFRENGTDFFQKALDTPRLIEISLTGQPGKEESKKGSVVVSSKEVSGRTLPGVWRISRRTNFYG